MRLPNILFPVFMFGFVFPLPLFFSPCWPLLAGRFLLAANISHFLTTPPPWKFHTFLPTKFVSFVLNTLSNSFSVIHVSVNIKNNVERDSTLLLIFLSKSPGDHTISGQNTSSCLWCLTCLLSYFTLVCLWCGRAAVRSRDCQNLMHF